MNNIFKIKIIALFKKIRSTKVKHMLGSYKLKKDINLE